MRKYGLVGDQIEVPRPCGKDARTDSQLGEREPRRRRGRGGELVDDLIKLRGPCTEAAIVECLKRRLHEEGKTFTRLGPVLISVRGRDILGTGQAATFNKEKLNNTSTSDNLQTQIGDFQKIEPSMRKSNEQVLEKFLSDILFSQQASGKSQSIVLTGASGSGKTHTSVQVVSRLFELCGNYSHQTDMCKHLEAAYRVLAPLTQATTKDNRDSSRMVLFTDCQIVDGALQRVRLHQHFLEKRRAVCRTEGSFKILRLLAEGLPVQDRLQFHLENLEQHLPCFADQGKYSPPRHTNHSNIGTHQEALNAWRADLATLGIPCADILRVLAAVLLLGGLEPDQPGEVGSRLGQLLGVQPNALQAGLSMRTHNVQGEIFTLECDPSHFYKARDGLATSLYSRVVATIIRRVNSLSLTPPSSTTGNSSPEKSLESLVLPTTSSIGILDMPGLTRVKSSSGLNLEQLGLNLATETIHHLSNSHLLRSPMTAAVEEGLAAPHAGSSINESPATIDLLSSVHHGILRLVDRESQQAGSTSTLMASLVATHSSHPQLAAVQSTSFAIRHFAGTVSYDASQFLETNRDTMTDDLVAVFAKSSCTSGFVSHLFATELRHLTSCQQPGVKGSKPQGVEYRLGPTSHLELPSGEQPSSSLSSDLLTRLDSLLRSLLHTKLHFIVCIAPSREDGGAQWNGGFVAEQCRAIELLEVCQLFTSGLPHKLRPETFLARYGFLLSKGQTSKQERQDNKNGNHAQGQESLTLKKMDNSILETAASESRKQEFMNALATLRQEWCGWNGFYMEAVLGSRHLFLSEGARQHLERRRRLARSGAARVVQR